MSVRNGGKLASLVVAGFAVAREPALRLASRVMLELRRVGFRAVASGVWLVAASWLVGLVGQPLASAQVIVEPYAVSTLAGIPGRTGSLDGAARPPYLRSPGGVAVDQAGNIFVADAYNHAIRKVTSDGRVHTVAGQLGKPGSTDGNASEARFNIPTGIAIAPDGNIYVADRGDHTIRMVTPDGFVTTLAGVAGGMGVADGSGSAARFNQPSSVAIDADHNIYVADTGNHTIRKVTQSGVTSTLAGLAGARGANDGLRELARFDRPSGVAVSAQGLIYVADNDNCTIRKVTAAGVVNTVAGAAGQFGSADGPALDARFSYPSGVAVDSAGNVYISDQHNHTIRRLGTDGVVSTIAGSPDETGWFDGAGAAARFEFPRNVAVGGDGVVYVADEWSHTLRRIGAQNVVTTLIGNRGVFSDPSGIALDAAQNLYVADTMNHTVRKITPAGVISTIAGAPGQAGSADGVGSAARFDRPSGVAIDLQGNILVADFFNGTVRKINRDGLVRTFPQTLERRSARALAVDRQGNIYIAAASAFLIRKMTPEGELSDFAGKLSASGCTDGTGSEARLGGPMGIATDASGNVYVADWVCHSVRKITPAGVVTTLAGRERGGADGIGTAARFEHPTGVAVDGAGNVYVTDWNGLRKVTASGVVTTLAGRFNNFGSDDGRGAAALFYDPDGIAIGTAGRLYIADTNNELIRVAVPAPPLEVVSIARTASNTVRLRCLGISNAVNRIETSATLTPGSFSTAASIPADSSGAFEYETPATEAKKFFRLIYP